MSKAAPTASFSRYPMFWLAACFAVGILVAYFGTVPPLRSAIVCASAAIAGFLFRRNQYDTPFMALAFIAAGGVTFGAQIASIKGDRLNLLYDTGAFLSSAPVEIEGVLTGAPEPSIGGRFLVLRAESVLYRGEERKVSGNVRLFAPAGLGDENPERQDLGSDISNLKYGSRVRVACSLGREDEYLNPGVQGRRETLDRQEIDAACSLKSSLLIEHIADESVFLPLAWVYDQRAKLIGDFRTNLNPSAAGAMIASLLGDKYFLDKDTGDLFREGGTFHILVISGLHITFIGGLLLLFMRRATRNRMMQFAVTAAALWGYTLAVGADVPVVRAAVMFTVLLFGYAIFRQGSSLNSLGISALVLLVWRPEDLLDPSFHLTFASVGTIVLVAYPLIAHLRQIGEWTPTPSDPFPPNVPAWLRGLCERIYWRESVWAIESKRNIWTGGLHKRPSLSRQIGDVGQKAIRYVFEAVVMSLTVQIAMLPLSVIYFHRVSLSGIVLNLWVGLFIAIESFAAVAGALASNISEWLAAPLFGVASIANSLMLALPRLLSRADWSSFRVPAYTGPARAVYLMFPAAFALLAILLARWDPFTLRPPKKARISFFAVATVISIAIGITVFHPLSAARPDGRLHVDFLDVGQGDSALITFPNGETWLVDGGGRPNYDAAEGEDAFVPDRRGVGEAVVSEVLWAMGYSHIDHILVTHADADHIQGLVDVAKNFSIGSAILGTTTIEDPDLAALLDVLARRKIPVKVAGRGDRVNVGGAMVEVMFPFRTDDAVAPSDNNHSVVLRIVFGSRAFLLTGDIERQAESDLIAGGGTLAADVVKVAHHGSRTSSTAEFIMASHPQFAVISVGRHSPFGHPHTDVVERWQNAGVQVVTTGENGMISVSTDGKGLTLSRFVPE